MPTTQELLDLINNMQQNAQAGLPVIPNNGNPNGANNMPHAKGPGNKYGTAPRHFYPWMNPSPSVANIDQLLAQPLIGSPVQNDVGIQPVPNQPVVPRPTVPPPALPVLPQMPNRAPPQAQGPNAMPVIPRVVNPPKLY